LDSAGTQKVQAKDSYRYLKNQNAKFFNGIV
jgi:hypothetical protein